ncbi:hypothetical protein TNCV_1738511 [Trichonephila clavipes]|nr:hypothetical protein TNCV_1738511 [Trichonephila clavipes]
MTTNMLLSQSDVLGSGPRMSNAIRSKGSPTLSLPSGFLHTLAPSTKYSREIISRTFADQSEKAKVVDIVFGEFLAEPKIQSIIKGVQIQQPCVGESPKLQQLLLNITARVIERDTSGEIYCILEDSRGFRTRQHGRQ